MTTISVQMMLDGGTAPSYRSGGASGMDLIALVGEETFLAPGERALIPTGVYLEIPPGFEAQVRPRSGLAAKNGITVLNTPGTIDSDYRGEIKVILINLGTDRFAIRNGDRIAQLVFSPVVRADLVEKEVLGTTERGAGGFGSTGVRNE